MSKNNDTGFPEDRGVVGPEMDEHAPSILKGETKEDEAAAAADTADGPVQQPNVRTSQENVKQQNNGSYQQPNYQGGAQAMPAYNYYQKKRGGWKKGLLIFVIIVAALLFFGYTINNFFDNLLPSSANYEDTFSQPENDYIARIAVEGVISSDTSDGYLSSETKYNHRFTIDTIDNLIDDSKNKAMIIFVDTPGGGVYESDELYLKIKEYQDTTSRPVYVAMGTMAASGGYYISATADKILANRNCWTGSIGVTLGTLFDVSEFLENYGVKTETITSGKNKAMGGYFDPMTKEQKKIFQSLVDGAYEQFVGIVADGRKMNIDDVKTIADGRIYNAEQAMQNGLIDGIATEKEATQMLKDDKDLGECDVVPFEHYVERTWLDNFLGLKFDSITEKLDALGTSDLKTALDLASENSKAPLMYLYVR